MDKSATQWMVEPLRKFADFQGRARRAEYWWFYLLTIFVTVGITVVEAVGSDGGGTGLLMGLAFLAFLIPSLAVAIRRLHDLDRSGWWCLIALVPFVGGIVLLIWTCSRGTSGGNRFGPDPITGIGAAATA